MKFLLSNDDGISAPGLSALEQATNELGDCITIAPNRHLSGCSHKVTTDRPLTLETVSKNRYALDGTPADCTRIGITHLAPNIDWLLSGINDGGNLGVDVMMSGTVAAVREAAWHGIKGIAISQYKKGRGEFDWSAVVPLVKRVLARLLDQPLERGAFWNVNLPDLRTDHGSVTDSSLIEFADCKLNPHPLQTGFDVSGNIYSYRGVYSDRPREPGSDVDACFAGQVAITKILPY